MQKRAPKKKNQKIQHQYQQNHGLAPASTVADEDAWPEREEAEKQPLPEDVRGTVPSQGF
jgi:hypothetical protein